MANLKLVQQRPIPGAHYDPSLPWSREPNLRPILQTRGMSQRRYDEAVWKMTTHSLAFVAGILATVIPLFW